MSLAFKLYEVYVLLSLKKINEHYFNWKKIYCGGVNLTTINTL